MTPKEAAQTLRSGLKAAGFKARVFITNGRVTLKSNPDGPRRSVVMPLANFALLRLEILDSHWPLVREAVRPLVSADTMDNLEASYAE